MNQLKINLEKKSNEKFHILSNRKVPPSVEQQLVDCSTGFGNDGCNGSLMDNSYKYLIHNHGIDTNASYPYEARMGKCRFNVKTIATDSYVDIKAGSEVDLEDALATIVPIAVAMDASQSSSQFYLSGVYSDSQSSSTNIDFSLLAVGYESITTTDKQDYYILKNQWTTKWGMDGYV